jgi:hypothetical protein
VATPLLPPQKTCISIIYYSKREKITEKISINLIKTVNKKF